MDNVMDSYDNKTTIGEFSHTQHTFYEIKVWYQIYIQMKLMEPMQVVTTIFG